MTQALSPEPTVIVAHSLGTVVWYSILKRAREFKVPLFVTVGSPLGVQVVRDYFKPLRRLSVGQRYNAYDPRDTVALFPLDTSRWPIKPGIDNFGKVDNQTDNRHGIIGYLDDATIGGVIGNSLFGK